jgi:hypothetical protein
MAGSIPIIIVTYPLSLYVLPDMCVDITCHILEKQIYAGTGVRTSQDMACDMAKEYRNIIQKFL